jgi:GrpB-like predicted nucleotidyltransferase (UPF0157 family)
MAIREETGVSCNSQVLQHWKGAPHEKFHQEVLFMWVMQHSLEYAECRSEISEHLLNEIVVIRRRTFSRRSLAFRRCLRANPIIEENMADTRGSLEVEEGIDQGKD